MKIKYTILSVAALTALTTSVSGPSAFADTPGRHPGYMHAEADLRYARIFLARPDLPNVEGDERRAMREIDACVKDLQAAAWYDRKNSIEQPPPDVGTDRKGRLQKALEVLRKARADMDKEEDDPAAIGFQANANKHVDRAIGFTRRAIGDKFDDGFLR